MAAADRALRGVHGLGHVSGQQRRRAEQRTRDGQCASRADGAVPSSHAARLRPPLLFRRTRPAAAGTGAVLITGFGEMVLCKAVAVNDLLSVKGVLPDTISPATRMR